MRRRIDDFVQDDVGDWVALLDCLHRQHVRHDPPFRTAPWVLDERQRGGRIGTPIDCPLCDRCELPSDLTVVRTSPTWDETSLPDGLRRDHRLAARTWGQLRVEAGGLRFVAQMDPSTNTVLGPGGTQAIPPEVVHHVEVPATVRFAIDFLTRAG